MFKGKLIIIVGFFKKIFFPISYFQVQFSWLFFAGAIHVFFSFFIVTLLCHYNNWDPVMVGIRRIFVFICRKHRIQRVPEDSEQCESLIPMHSVSQEDGASQLLSLVQLDDGAMYSEETISGKFLQKNVSVPSLKNNSFSSLEL